MQDQMGISGAQNGDVHPTLYHQTCPSCSHSTNDRLLTNSIGETTSESTKSRRRPECISSTALQRGWLKFQPPKPNGLVTGLITFSLLVLVVSSTSNHTRLNSKNESRIKVNISIVLPASVHKIYPSMEIVHPAIEIAMRKVNRDETILQGIELVIGGTKDSSCAAATGPLMAAELYYQGVANLFLGPFCSQVIAPVARYSNRWGIPVMSPSALEHAFGGSKPEFRTLTKMEASFNKAVLFTQMVLHDFNFFRVGLYFYKEEGLTILTPQTGFFDMSRSLYWQLNTKHGPPPYRTFMQVNETIFGQDLEYLSGKARSEYIMTSDGRRDV